MNNKDVKRVPDSAKTGDIAVVRDHDEKCCVIMVCVLVRGKKSWIEHSRYNISMDRLKILLSKGQIDLTFKSIVN